VKIAGLVVAAGRGERAGGRLPKQYWPVGGRPLLRWSIEALAAAGAKPLVVAVAEEHTDLFDAAVAGCPPIFAVRGGANRTGSVRAGLDALAETAPDIVLIHDAARPGLKPSLVAALCAEIEAGADGAGPALALADSLRRVDQIGRVVGEADRQGLMRVQTPQAFRYAAIRAAYAALPPDAAPTDDIAVALVAGLDVRLIAGDQALMKLTFAEDADLLERVLGETRVTCVGAGYDAHRFGAGDHVMLCGVRIAHARGLIGHSDADAGWHALVDAILGALGQGDIGAHFPPSDPQWKGANSEKFLRHAVTLAAQSGARIQHVDITMICENPKIGPHREAMRARTAEVLGLPVARVSVKATTTERMGFTGREEGLSAQAVATLECVR
jgi:2-C-methyl-D-erythritol 4-phosphate cytidylyltransferase/2-C-methyl-D-erythritol 2,4-cyclodiphosphate synthase